MRKLRDSGFKARRYTDFRAMKWSKLLFNILGNAQSAILDLPPSHVFADSELGDCRTQPLPGNANT